MADRKFQVSGTDIELNEVAKWDRLTIADGRWLNANTIEPLIDNDIILAKKISASSDPTMLKWFRGYSSINSLNLPTMSHAVNDEFIMNGLDRYEGTLTSNSGQLLLSLENKIYEWHALVEVSNAGQCANTEADIAVTLLKYNDSISEEYKIIAKLPINEHNKIDIPLSGITSGSAESQISLGLKFYAGLKENDSRLDSKSVVFNFNLKQFEVVEK
jgi:hypothetical protein